MSVLLGVGCTVVPARLPQLSVVKASISAVFCLLTSILFSECLCVRCFAGVAKIRFPSQFSPEIPLFTLNCCTLSFGKPPSPLPCFVTRSSFPCWSFIPGDGCICTEPDCVPWRQENLLQLGTQGKQEEMVQDVSQNFHPVWRNAFFIQSCYV